MGNGGVNRTDLGTDRPAVAFDAVSKRFDSVPADVEVSFSVARGSLHALLGENGAGKTTLMRILAGELTPDSGRINVDGQPVRFRSPREARRVGIRMVHQHSVLIPSLSVLENFILEDTGDASLFPHLRRLSARLSAALAEFGMRVDPNRAVWELSPSERQWLEVFRAQYFGARVLVLDEPTAQLSPIEGDALLARVQALCRDGATAILITHKMREVLTYADTVTVLRKGRWIATRAVQVGDGDALAAMMVGDAVSEQGTGGRATRPVEIAAPCLTVSKARSKDSRGQWVLRDITFDLARGEVLGVAGVAGNGQGELARIAAGERHPDTGSVNWPGAPPAARRHIPEDRVHVGTAARLSVRDNLVLRDFRHEPCSAHGWLNRTALDRLAAARVDDFRIAAQSLDSPVSHLSGGNLQRVVVAREMDGDIGLLVAHNPTAGLDIATAAYVRERLVRVARQGSGVLFISDDLDELITCADRLLVLYSGGIAGILERRDFDRAAIARLMSGTDTVRFEPPAVNP